MSLSLKQAPFTLPEFSLDRSLQDDEQKSQSKLWTTHFCGSGFNGFDAFVFEVVLGIIVCWQHDASPFGSFVRSSKQQGLVSAPRAFR